MIQHMKHMPRPRPRQRVVKRGADVDQHQGRRIDSNNSPHPRRPRVDARSDTPPRHREQRPDAMSNGIGQQVPEPRLRVHTPRIVLCG